MVKCQQLRGLTGVFERASRLAPRRWREPSVVSCQSVGMPRYCAPHTAVPTALGVPQRAVVWGDLARMFVATCCHSRPSIQGAEAPNTGLCVAAKWVRFELRMLSPGLYKDYV
jgi:hypothetical protein